MARSYHSYMAAKIKDKRQMAAMDHALALCS